MARLVSQRDTPNTSREYETIYILRPNTPNEGVAEVNTRIRNIIETMGGKVIKVDNWGKRRLAYEVAKERKGIYLYWQYLAQPGVVEETERNLRMLDSVIRYLTVKVDENIVIDARPSEIDDTSYDKASQTAADEEDMFLSRGGADDLLADPDDEDDYTAPGFEDGGDGSSSSSRSSEPAAPTATKDEE